MAGVTTMSPGRGSASRTSAGDDVPGLAVLAGQHAELTGAGLAHPAGQGDLVGLEP